MSGLSIGGSQIDASWFLILAAILFIIGTAGVLVRRNPLVILICIELMLNAANLTLVVFSLQLHNLEGQLFALMSMTVAAFSISSMQMRMTSGLRRTSTPAVPMMNRIAVRIKNQDASICDPPIDNPLISPWSSSVVDLLAAQVEGADCGDQQEDRGQLEGIQVGGEQPDRDRLHRSEDGEIRSLIGLAVLNALHHGPDQSEECEDEQGGEPRLEAQPGPRQLARGTEEGDHEQEQDHDRARVPE